MKNKKIVFDSETVKRICNNDTVFGGKLYSQCYKPLKKNYNKMYSHYKFMDFDIIFENSLFEFWNEVNKKELNELNTDIEGYIWGIMKKKIKNIIKKQILKEKYLKEISVENYSQFEKYEEEQDDFEKKQIVYNTIESFEEPCKSILHLFYYRKVSYKDMVGYIRGYDSSDAIKSKSYQCRKKLENILMKEFKNIN